MNAPNVTWQEALKRLKDGNERFTQDLLNTENSDNGRRTELVGGQHPYAIILSCADSRVVPELAFDTGLGELFTIRVAGNVANSSTLASIEYAVAHLGTNLIVVMGHESCGAVTAAINGGDNGYNLNHLLAHIVPAINASEDQSINAIVKKNAAMTASDILSRSPIIQAENDRRELKIISAYYNLGSGKVDFMD